MGLLLLLRRRGRSTHTTNQEHPTLCKQQEYKRRRSHVKADRTWEQNVISLNKEPRQQKEKTGNKDCRAHDVHVTRLRHTSWICIRSSERLFMNVASAGLSSSPHQLLQLHQPCRAGRVYSASIMWLWPQTSLQTRWSCLFHSKQQTNSSNGFTHSHTPQHSNINQLFQRTLWMLSINCVWGVLRPPPPPAAPRLTSQHVWSRGRFALCELHEEDTTP